jgi:hypothetical protein
MPLQHQPDLLRNPSWAHVSRAPELWKHLVYELRLVCVLDVRDLFWDLLMFLSNLYAAVMSM